MCELPIPYFALCTQVITDPEHPDEQSPVLSFPQLAKQASRLSTRQINRPTIPLRCGDQYALTPT
jgi:hypothetical protein